MTSLTRGRRSPPRDRRPTPNQTRFPLSGSAGTAGCHASGSPVTGRGGTRSRRRGSLARTTKSTPLESLDDLRPMLRELWQFVEEAGRDPGGIDVSFGSEAGGNPAADSFNADAHLEALAELARLGVTWSGVGVPGDSVDHAIETLQRFGESVIR